MKINTVKKISSILFSNPNVFFEKKKFIFLVSHMRSYSSLFSHILGSNKDISGYAEMHIKYKNWADLIRLKHKVYTSNNNNLRGQYVLDKILHNHHTISESILNRENVNLIVNLREPVSTLKSILNMEQNITRSKMFRNKEDVLYYYISRLDEIQRIVSKATCNVLFLKSEKFLNDTGYVLNFVSKWLKLETMLSPGYSKFKHTGQAGYGDPSDLINQGQIVRKNNKYDDIKLPAEIINRAVEKYESVLKVLPLYCNSI